MGPKSNASNIIVVAQGNTRCVVSLSRSDEKYFTACWTLETPELNRLGTSFSTVNRNL